MDSAIDMLPSEPAIFLPPPLTDGFTPKLWLDIDMVVVMSILFTSVATGLAATVVAACSTGVEGLANTSLASSFKSILKNLFKIGQFWQSIV